MAPNDRSGDTEASVFMGGRDRPGHDDLREMTAPIW
jgi:hypothetical protein